MQLRSLVAVACLGVVLVAAPRVAAACSKRHQTVFELFDQATDVAVVKVGKVPPRHAGPVALRVKDRLKGAGRAGLTGLENNTSCATGFRTGRTALVFLGKDRRPAGSYEGYIERPSAALLLLLRTWSTLQRDVDRADLLVSAIGGSERGLRLDAAMYLLDHPALIAALTADHTAALVAARGTDHVEGLMVAILARQHGQAWRDLVAAKALPVRAPALAALAAHDLEAITDVGALADLIARTKGEHAPERIAALERCERVHGKLLEEFTTYSTGRAEQWWGKLAEACRTGTPPRW